MTVNNNLNAMLATQLQVTDTANKLADIANVVGDPENMEVTSDLIDSIVGQIPQIASYQANAKGIETQQEVSDMLLNIRA